MKSKKVSKSRRTPKRLTNTLYSYVEPINWKYARGYGKKNFGSFSAYVDALITADRKNHILEVPKDNVSQFKRAKIKAGEETKVAA